MLQPKTEPECSERPLPLFRAEALAAQQQKFYGEILLIRPLSLTLLVWLGIGLAAAVIGFLLAGHYTERVHVSGIIVSAPNSTSSEANLYVPVRAVNFVRPGEAVVLQSSADQKPGPESAVVTEISKSALSPEVVAAQTGLAIADPMYKVTLKLSAAGQAQNGTRVEADLPLDRRPLLQWLFERPGSSGKT
jgi:hypothetical protein